MSIDALLMPQTETRGPVTPQAQLAEDTPGIAVVEGAGSPEDVAPDTAAPESKKTDRKEPSDTKKFAALSRKAKELRQQEVQLKQRSDALEHTRAQTEIATKRAEDYDKIKANAKQNPLQFLKESGLTYDEVSRFILEGGKIPEVDPLDEKLNPIKKQLSELEELKAWKQQQEQLSASQKEESARKQVLQNIEEAAKANDFELVQSFGDEGKAAVYSVMEEYYNTNKVILPYDEACQMVEEYYEQNIIEKLAKSNKMRAAVQKLLQSDNKSGKTKTSSTKPNTLTQSAGAVGRVNVDLDKMSDRDRIEYLAKTIKFDE